MNSQELSVQLNKLLAMLVAEEAQETSASFSDIKSALCEEILLHPIRVALELPDLESLNAAE